MNLEVSPTSSRLMAEDERWWVHDDEKEEESSKETAEDAMNKAEAEIKKA